MCSRSGRILNNPSMNKRGPIIVIEDDMDDQEVLTMVFHELKCPNEIVFFKDGEEAMDYLTLGSRHPFMVLCDINIPRLNGYELKQLANAEGVLKGKCVPFLFFTTSSSEKDVCDAYDQSVQGFFMKPTNYESLLKIIKVILEYWGECYAPVAQNAEAMPA